MTAIQAKTLTNKQILVTKQQQICIHTLIPKTKSTKLNTIYCLLILSKSFTHPTQQGEKQ